MVEKGGNIDRHGEGDLILVVYHPNEEEKIQIRAGIFKLSEENYFQFSRGYEYDKETGKIMLLEEFRKRFYKENVKGSLTLMPFGTMEDEFGEYFKEIRAGTDKAK